MQKKVHLAVAAIIYIILAKVFGLEYGLVIWAVIGAVATDIDTFFMHRVATHNVFALAGICGLLYYTGSIDVPALIAFAIGFGSHIMLDSVTPTGTKPLWPLKNDVISGPIEYESSMEYLVVLGFIIIAYYLLKGDLASLLPK
jgi:membrane-bound metal-dependent hydrolase YbcI (DUF457 family)